MITLRTMEKADATILENFLSRESEAFMNQWGGGRWYRYPVTAAQILGVMAARSANTMYFMIINDGVAVGSVELDFIDLIQKKCTVCRFLIAGEYRSKGLGEQSLRAIVRLAFETLDMKTIQLSVFDFNTAAIRCYEKLGFAKIAQETRSNGWIAHKMELKKP